MTSMIEGMDTIPREIAEKFHGLFAVYLPGWSVDGIYNFQPGAASQQAAGQLELLMHSK